MISNFKQHYRGVTTSIVAPPVLLFAKVSARRAKYKANVQKLSLFISEPLLDLRVSESARRAKYELKRMAKVQGESARRAIFFHHITMNFNHIYFIFHHLCTVLNMGKCLECLFFVFLQ